MNEEPKKLCPFQSDSQGDVHCDESDCMAWREIKTGRWDCALIVKGE